MGKWIEYKIVKREPVLQGGRTVGYLETLECGHVNPTMRKDPMPLIPCLTCMKARDNGEEVKVLMAPANQNTAETAVTLSPEHDMPEAVRDAREWDPEGKGGAC
jgi:hypothetical protein